MVGANAAEEAEIGFWGGVLRRRRALIAAVVAVSVAAVAAVFLVRPTTYTAVAEVLVDPAATSAEVEFLDSVRVRLAAEERLGVEPDVTITGAEGVSIVTVAATALTPAAAAAAANAYVEQYVQIRGEESGREREQIVARLQGTIAEVDRRLAAPDLAPEEIQSLEQQRVALSTALVGSAVPDQRPPVVLTAASERETTSPDLLTYLAVALAAGIMVGVAAAGVAEHTDGRVGRGPRASAALGMPLLGAAPAPPRRAWLPWRRRRAARNGAGIISGPGTAAADAYTMIRIRLQSREGYKPHGAVQVLAVRQADLGYGTAVGLNLAQSYARAGLHTVLVPADYRDTEDYPGILGVGADGAGLTEVLAGSTELHDALQPVPATPNLQVLPLGARPESIVDALSTAEFAELLDRLGFAADVVVVLTPTMARHPDALLVAHAVDALVVVAGRDTPVRDLERAADELGTAGPPVRGVVFTGPVRR